MSSRWALAFLLLEASILCCASVRHDDDMPHPDALGLGASVAQMNGSGIEWVNTSTDRASLLADLKVLCGSEKTFGAHDYKLHCDQHLSKIRDVFQVPTPEEILDSNHIELDQAEEGTGKSGAKMLFSNDKQYIIKTMSDRDIKALTPIIHQYTMHVLNHASTSLMMRFYGLLQDGSGQFWIIANNWLPVSFPIVWDLKGSSSGRTSGLEQKGQKDNDWKKAHKEIALAPAQRARVLEALESDSSLLASANLIDYSLITGLLVYELAPCNGKGQPSCISPVCHPTAGCGETAYKLGDYYNLIPQVLCRGNQPKPPELGSSCMGALTKSLRVHLSCFGIIDLLKPFDAKSKAEYLATGSVFGRKVSVKPAEGYGERFFSFMHDTVFPSKASDGTIALPMDGSVCSEWGSRGEEGKGGFPIKTVVGLSLLFAGGAAFATWYYMSQSPTADPGMDASGAAWSDPSQSYPQGYPGYPQEAYAGYGQDYSQGYPPQGTWPPGGYPPAAQPA